MITKKDFQQVLDKASGLRSLVIGDAMLDRYIYGIVERISPEAPVPVMSHQRTEIKAGGAANVALNLAAWGCDTYLAGLTGEDENAEALKSILTERGIHNLLIKSRSRPTTVKTRVVAASHHLLRIDEESSDYLTGLEEKDVLRQIMKYMEEVKPQLLILEDYNKGLLTSKIIHQVIAYARRHKIFVAADPKEKHFNDFKNIDLFKPNLREAAHAARRNLEPNDLGKFSAEWRQNLGIGTVAITLGGQGVYLHNQDNAHHVKPVRSIDVIDVCGAGDAVICALALAQISGLDLLKSGDLANLTGAFVCSHSGVVAVDTGEIDTWI